MRRLRAGDPAPMAGWLREHLFGHVLPFWEKYAFDPRGGLSTCINDAGEVLSTDKWLWCQWRAVWVFSRIYHQLGHDPRWLKYARNIAEFAIGAGWDEAGDGWGQALSGDGKLLRGYSSIYDDAFAVYGLQELYKASREDSFAQLARRTADAALKKLAHPYDTIPHFPYPIPRGAKPHGIPMLWSYELAELGHALQEEKYLKAAKRLSDEIFRDHFRPDRNLFLEFVQLDGGEFPGPQGAAVVPGHVIEDMWFQIHVAGLLDLPPERTKNALEAILRHLKLGWDPTQGGGLLLAVDAEGRDEVGWNFATSKLWWPHTEALYAMLLGWTMTGRAEFLEWYERLWEFCLAHFVDWENGEWRQKLDRSLAPLTGVVALPVKDPFHLPRSLIFQIELLEKGFDPKR